MRGGRRTGRGDRLAHDLARHRARAEGADRPPGVQRLQGGFAEEVVGGRADELRGRARVAGPVDPAHHRGRHPLRLAHHDARGRRDLVGERHDRDLELATGVIRRAAQVHRRGHPRDADRHVDEALAPGTTERVGDRRRRAAEAPAAPSETSRRRRAEPSGSSGSSVSSPSATLEASTPAFAQTNPCAVSTMTRSPRRATTRFVSAAIDRIAVRGRGDACPPPWTPPSGSPRRRRPRPGPSARSRRRGAAPGRLPGRSRATPRRAGRSIVTRAAPARRARRPRHARRRP